MRAVILSVLLVLAAPVLQVTVVNGWSLPGGVPDIVLICVIALAPALWSYTGSRTGTGAGAGALLGFAAGLAADVAPPADHTIGRLALVLCLAGWVSTRIPADDGAGRRVAGAAVVALCASFAGGVLAALLDGTPWAAALAPGAIAWTTGGAALVTAGLALLPRRRSFGRVPASRPLYARGGRRA
ncbi:hypothetical protein F5972_35140 [Microbispora cellulosiformans]|uniref:Rod shape-determining protein MreD n=1 Tax=Microbispora cellulosiformans TaxID=2614688 RepID=A0A5J5JSI9_9ACTN|nr:hypothetical protein [Microbispora cellulosiformans]KAA9373469.1 hypothetical protein F5972_35140 [Microbispora cellulosiformans]